jgi:hypothetical protein
MRILVIGNYKIGEKLESKAQAQGAPLPKLKLWTPCYPEGAEINADIGNWRL